MDRHNIIDLVKTQLSDSPRLTILKSQHNRFAIQINLSKDLSEMEKKNLLVKIAYLKQQIDSYPLF